MKRAVIIACVAIALINPSVRSAEGVIRVAVMPFMKGNKGDAIVSEVTAALSRYSFISLVERAKLDKLMKEAELGQAGIVDEAMAVKLGKVHGVEVMIIGSVRGDTVSARAIHVETQKILVAYTITGSGTIDELGTKLASGIETFLAREELKKLRNDSPDIDLDFWISRKNGGKVTDRLRIGESVVFHFKANRDGFVTIVDLQPGGDVVVLYPNDYSGENGVRAGQEYRIPGDSDGFEISVSEPAGTDTVVAFFTSKQVDWLDRKKLQGEGFKTVIDKERYAMTRGFKVTATKLGRNDWESRTLEVEVVK